MLTLYDYDFKRKKLRKVKVLRKFGLLLSVCLVLMFGNAQAKGFVESMNVKIGVFEAATIKLDYNNNDVFYNISAEIATANFFGKMYPFTAKYMSKGKVLETTVLPDVYETYTESRKHIRTKKIFYDDKGIAYKRVSTKDEKVNEREIKNVPETANSGDLQTIFAILLSNFDKTKNCDILREVYDGKKHYKVIAKSEGIETKYFDFMKKSGPAYKCSLYIENLKENNDNILWDVSADKPINIWIGLDEKTKIPYVLEIRIDSTPLGAVEIKPSTLEIK